MRNTTTGTDSGKSETEMLREIHARTKRLETRTTTLMIALGVATKAQRPRFFAGSADRGPYVIIPSRHSGLQEIIDSIPETCHGEVAVLIGSDRVATITAHRAT